MWLYGAMLAPVSITRFGRRPQVTGDRLPAARPARPAVGVHPRQVVRDTRRDWRPAEHSGHPASPSCPACRPPRQCQEAAPARDHLGHRLQRVAVAAADRRRPWARRRGSCGWCRRARGCSRPAAGRWARRSATPRSEVRPAPFEDVGAGVAEPDRRHQRLVEVLLPALSVRAVVTALFRKSNRSGAALA